MDAAGGRDLERRPALLLELVDRLIGEDDRAGEQQLVPEDIHQRRTRQPSESRGRVPASLGRRGLIGCQIPGAGAQADRRIELKTVRNGFIAPTEYLDLTVTVRTSPQSNPLISVS